MGIELSLRRAPIHSSPSIGTKWCEQALCTATINLNMRFLPHNGWPAVAGTRDAVSSRENSMMDAMQSMMGGMGWVGVLVIVALVLAIAALIKYLMK